MSVRHRIATSALLTALVFALGLAAAAAPAPAMAQTCQITKNENGGWVRAAGVGEVVTFGDLKIRMVEDGPHSEPVDWRIVDLKAPGYQLNGVRLVADHPVTFTACGQEVTLTYTFGYPGLITIGLF